ncbi:MAG: PQQ-binding-like beta-propeller repeat protein [Bythopirellula sp.]
MKTKLVALFAITLTVTVSQVGANELARRSSHDWPMFRGPAGRSVGQAQELPTDWSIEDGENVAWQVDLPGRGVSGPIVVGGKVIITASSGPTRDRLHVLAYDSQSGEKLWHRQFWATGKSLCHATSANAAPTPASDGERIFAFYSSNDLISLDLDGNLLWMRGLELDYPGAGNALGMSSSPVVVGDVVVVQSEAQGNSFVAALDRQTGKTRWDVERPKASNWCSPIAVDAEYTIDKQPAVVLQSGEGIRLHRADNGEVLLKIDTACETIPSLTFNEYLYAPSNGIQVFDIMSAGLEDKDQPVWQESKLQPGSPSPVVVDSQVFVINRGGVLSCGSMTEKEVMWKLRLGGRFWATPVSVGNYLYCINADGKCFVVERGQAGEKGRIVAENEFGEDVLSSPAVADNGLFVRSHAHLWRIAK